MYILLYKKHPQIHPTNISLPDGQFFSRWKSLLE